MNEFVRKHEDRIRGVLSCFDRMLFRGLLPIMSGWSMAQLLQAHEIDCSSVKPFLLANAERVKAHPLALAREHGRPFENLNSKLRKEDAARKIAGCDGIDHGLVCAFSALEPCRTLSLRFTTGHPYVQPAKRKCLQPSTICCAIPRASPTGSSASRWSRTSTPRPASFGRTQQRLTGSQARDGAAHLPAGHDLRVRAFHRCARARYRARHRPAARRLLAGAQASTPSYAATRVDIADTVG